MRKIIFLSALLLAVNWLQAQYQTVVLKPGTFTAEDEVVLTISVAGTDLAGKTDLYIWIWSNEGAAGYTLINGVSNGEWTASKPEAKMTNLGDNRFSFKFTGTALFATEPGKLKHFQFLVKTVDGSAKISNDNSPAYAFEPIVFTPVPFRVFPNRVNSSDVVTVYLHQQLAPTTAEQRMTPTKVTVMLYDQDNHQIGDTKSWNVKPEGNGVFSYSFIPNIAWTIPAGKTATKFSFRFDGTGKDVNGNTVTITGTTTEKSIDALQ